MSEIIHKDKEGTRFKFRNLEYFANNGMVLIIDDRDGSMKFENTMQMRARAKSFAMDAVRMKAKEWKYRYEIKEMFDAAKNLMQVIKEAEEQGDPTNPIHAEQLARDKMKFVMSMSGTGHKGGPRRSPGGLIVPGE
jgi:hypothetical protein